jgi:peptidoglycan hydrolase-like protein with peptidoglycan-binding domain
MIAIQSGSVGAEVEDVQRRLTALGLSCGADDAGRFGSATGEAVRTFQQQRGLQADGIVGPDTWRSLVAAGTGSGTGCCTSPGPRSTATTSVTCSDGSTGWGSTPATTTGCTAHRPSTRCASSS